MIEIARRAIFQSLHQVINKSVQSFGRSMVERHRYQESSTRNKFTFDSFAMSFVPRGSASTKF